ncbi:HAD family hydrolase [Methylobacterium sp. WL12]|uniref:HAD family hydrolase n=1 Tax=Methylobacterium sp. WL12 TaxID=2603890 RepID=UPI00164F2862|nr:HAD family hydrolase [Methylobacterium sp. WL12]
MQFEVGVGPQGIVRALDHMAKSLVITFDVYGTLTQWDETVRDALGSILVARGRSGADVERVANAFEAESRRLQTVGAFRSYRSILRDSLRPALAVAAMEATAEDADVMIERLACVPSFPEVPSVLAALVAQGHTLAPISNTDDDLLARTLEGLGPVFATAVTAEQAQAYKPNPGLFRFAQRKLGVEMDHWLHVAQGTFSDHAVCSALGIQAIWVNRKGATLQDGLNPFAVIDDLSALPDIVSSP